MKKITVIVGLLALTVAITAMGEAGVFKHSDVIDYTFALQCTELEGDWNENILLPWDTAVKDYEKEYKKHQERVDILFDYRTWAKDRGAKIDEYGEPIDEDGSLIKGFGDHADAMKEAEKFTQWKKDNHIEDYWDVEHGKLIAYNHGLPDGSGNGAMAYSHVVKVTPNVIRIAGSWDKDGTGRVEGSFDRVSGHGEIKWFPLPLLDAHLGLVAYKMYLFQCDEAPKAKF